MIKAWVYKGGISDNSATTVFTVNTTNESGTSDSGYYVCKFKGIILHSLASSAAGHGAGRYYEGMYSKIMPDGGGAGAKESAVTEIHDTLNIAISSGNTDISSVVMTAEPDG